MNLGPPDYESVALGQAEQYTESIDDYFYTGLLYNQLGNVFFKSYDFNRAETYYQLAYENYIRCGKDIHRFYSLYGIGRCLIQLKQFNEAHSIMNDIRIWAEDKKDYQLMSASLLNQLLCSVRIENITDAKSEFKSYTDLFGFSDSDPFTLSVLARYYLLINNISLAANSLDLGWRCSASKQDSIQLWYCESLINEKLGNADSAIIFYKNAIDLQNENLRSLLNEPILGAQKEFFKTLSETESLKSRQRKSQLIIVSLLLLLFIVLTILSYIILKNRIESKRRDYLLTIAELSAKETFNLEQIKVLNKELDEKTLREKNVHKNIELLNGKIRMLFREQFEPTNFVLARFYEFMSNPEKAKRLYKIVEEQLKKFMSKENIERIDTFLNEFYDDIMSRLSNCPCSLSEKELNTFRFLLAGLSVKSVGTILKCSKDSIYKTRDRALKRIEGKSISLYLEIGNLLKNSQL